MKWTNVTYVEVKMRSRKSRGSGEVTLTQKKEPLNKNIPMQSKPVVGIGRRKLREEAGFYELMMLDSYIYSVSNDADAYAVIN